MLSIVARTEETGQENIIAEARFIRDEESAYGNLAFAVDKKYQGLVLPHTSIKY